jgi:hypothetical protein
MASTSSEYDQSEVDVEYNQAQIVEYDQAKVVVGPEGDQINPSEVIYYTERLKEYYDRSDNDVMSTVSTGTKTKYLDQLKDQLQIGEDDQSKAVVPDDPDPTGMRKILEQLGKEDLMNLVMNMAKKWEEGGRPSKRSLTQLVALYVKLALFAL